MRIVSQIIVIGLLTLTSFPLLRAQTPNAGTPSTEPPKFYFHQSSFEIPFAAQPGVNEIRLYISADRGATWTLHSRQPPEVAKFTFQALRDGEYWFSSESVADVNQPLLPRPDRAEQAVVIDTTKPQLDLKADVSPSGEVTTTFRLADANIDPQSFRLTYSPFDKENYQPVAATPASNPQVTGEFGGSATWQPNTDAKAIIIRAEILDAAKNKIVVDRRVFLPNSTLRRLPPSVAAQPPSIPADPFQRYESTPSAEFRPVANNATRPEPTAPPVSQPAEPPATTPAPVAQQPTPAPAQPQQSVVANSWDDRNKYQPVATEYRPSPAMQNGLPVDRRGLDLSVMPPGEKPNMTRSMRFSLDYDVDTVGPAGVASVELFTTTDGGRTWRSWGTDDDRTSPFFVEVDQEGIYGFRMVIHGKNNLASPIPKPGELADIWIGVDATQPKARITEARYGEGPQAGNLIIRWEAFDSYLSERPVKLSYGASPDGPWNTIAAGLENAGEYAWRADPNLPPQIYLRLEVHDEAGNSSIYQPAEPINVQGLTPKGRIRGFRPAGS